MGKGTILVVDDDPTITEMVRMALELEGYTVYCGPARNTGSAGGKATFRSQADIR